MSIDPLLISICLFQHKVNAPSRNDDTIFTPHLTPCSPGDPEAIEMTWMDIKSEELLEPELTLQDFIRAVQTARPTVNKDDIERHTSFTSDFGVYNKFVPFYSFEKGNFSKTVLPIGTRILS